MGREFRQLLIEAKAAPDEADEVEEKRFLNTIPGDRSNGWTSDHRKAKRGGGLMPKGAKNRARLAKRASQVADANTNRANSARWIRSGVDPKRPGNGIWRSGAGQIQELSRQARHHDNRAYRAGAVAGRLGRGGKGKTRFPKF